MVLLIIKRKNQPIKLLKKLTRRHLKASKLLLNIPRNRKSQSHQAQGTQEAETETTGHEVEEVVEEDTQAIIMMMIIVMIMEDLREVGDTQEVEEGGEVIIVIVMIMITIGQEVEGDLLLEELPVVEEEIHQAIRHIMINKFFFFTFFFTCFFLIYSF